MPLAAHGVTDTGRRTTNEDSLLVDLDRGLFIVADGMGGHNAGEVASAIAVRTIHDFVAEAGGLNEQTMTDGLCLANEEVLRAADHPDYAGMGTTVVAAYVHGDRFVFGSVGDSRIYLWRNNALTQLTTDDSWLSRVLSEDSVSPEEALNHPMRHVLTKVVGLRDDMEPAVARHAFGAGDVLVLCSDGLHGTVVDDAIARTVARGGSVKQIAERLVEQALKAGSMDNISVIIVRQE